MCRVWGGASGSIGPNRSNLEFRSRGGAGECLHPFVCLLAILVKESVES